MVLYRIWILAAGCLGPLFALLYCFAQANRPKAGQGAAQKKGACLPPTAKPAALLLGGLSLAAAVAYALVF